MTTSCGGPLQERPCPVLDCEEMIGGANGILNASNRQKTFCTIEFKLMRLGDVELFLIYLSKGQFGCFQLWCLRRWLNRPGWSSIALLVVLNSIFIFTCHSHFHMLSMFHLCFASSIEGSACDWRCTLVARRRASSPSSSLLCSPVSLFRW